MDIATVISLPVFFLTPFLGGNHLPLYYVTIDRFWIESAFIIFLICAITVSYFKKKALLVASADS